MRVFPIEGVYSKEKPTNQHLIDHSVILNSKTITSRNVILGVILFSERIYQLLETPFGMTIVEEENIHCF